MAKTIRFRTNLKPTYKYSLNRLIGELPRTIKIKDLVKHLVDSGITQTEFYRDRIIPIGSKKSITADRLLIYANVFDCTTDDLLNDQVKAKSIHEVMRPKRQVKHSLK